MDPKQALISLELFPGMTFEFLDRPPPGRSGCGGAWEYCGSCRARDVCGTTVKGSVYHCYETGFDVHPRCTNLKMRIEVDDTRFELRKGGDSKCDWCKKKKLEGSVKKVPGYCYTSRCGKHSFHVYCLKDMGLEHGSSSASGGREVAVRELRLQKKPRRGWESGVKKLGKVVGVFLKIVLGVLFGDPTMILASVVVHLLKP